MPYYPKQTSAVSLERLSCIQRYPPHYFPTLSSVFLFFPGRHVNVQVRETHEKIQYLNQDRQQKHPYSLVMPKGPAR